MYKTGPTKKGKAFSKDNPHVDMTLIEYDQFQCDSCGFVEGRAVAAFDDRLVILSSNKQGTERKDIAKGRMKKVKSTAKPRRQEPR
jgi:hypothetical protein